jgi:sialic acid synthase SpsE
MENKSKLIRKLNRPYFIAELNTSHFGNFQVAKKMISKAKEIGCDCVKFQSWTPESLYAENYFEKNPIAKRFFKKYSFSEKYLKNLAMYSKKINIHFSSTPYSVEEVDFLQKECNPAFIKIASMDLNNFYFLNHIAKKKLPVILSTGMGELDEISNAVKILKNGGNKELYILHCVSVYPTPGKLINIRNIIGLKKKFPNIDIGFSDHTNGSDFAIAATALGAKIIEKHFTLDSSQIGMDNNMATEPDEMSDLISKCNNVYHGLGSTERKVSLEEKKQKKIMRRSIIFKRNMFADEKIKIEDLDFKRPGTGIALDKLKKVIGKKLKKSIKAQKLFHLKDLK